MSQSADPSRPEPATSGALRRDTDVGSVFVSNYPPYSVWDESYLPQVGQVLETPPEAAMPLGLYLHIPFCRKRCKFCYFRVYTDKNSDQIQTYLDALGREVELYAATQRVEGRPLSFVYFGGGTPSYISARHLRALVDRLRQALPWDGAKEIAFECEPGTLTQAKLEAIKEIGVTRLSLGVENLNDTILEENGRAHVSKEVYRVMPWIRQLGFEQVNIDLIAGMVGETEASWQETVRRAVDLDPDSVTVYQMELPFNTVYSKSVLDGGAPAFADWETKRRWHRQAIEAFEAAGYQVSSAYTLVKKGRRVDFVYRDEVWRGSDMIGAGVASFGHMGGVHCQNETQWDPYLEAVNNGHLPHRRAYRPSSQECLTREMILQLKLGRIEAGYFRQKFGVDILEEYAETWARLGSEGMLELGGDAVSLTRQGLLQVDGLLPEFYHPDYRQRRYT
jgi:oxygen-independent coproporphyrinogen III oxidase